jgi:MFS family permease
VTVLSIARAVQGLGASAMFASSLALLANAFPAGRERGGAMAAYGATIGGSFAVGPLVGGALTSGLSWRWIFLVNLPIGVGTLLLTLRRVEESRDPRPRRIDLLGQITLTVGLLLLTLALLRGNDDGWSSARTLGELAGAAGFLSSFVLAEWRARDPMLPLRLFRIPAFTAAQLSAFAISASFFAAYLYATLYLQDVLGLSAIDAGLAYLPATLTIFVVSGATAKLAETVPPRVMIAGGLALVSVGMALTTIAGTNSTWIAIQPGFLIAALGTGLFNPALSTVALGAVPGTMSGLAAGANDTARQTGIAVGIAGLGALIPVQSIHLHSNTYVHHLHVAYLVAAGIAMAGAGAAWRLMGSHRRQPAVHPAPVPTKAG